jgi:hypothetical protein
MLTNIKTKAGKLLPIDFSQWKVDEDSTCKILDEIDGNLVLENKSGHIASICKHLIQDNLIRITKDYIDIKGLYHHYFITNYLANDKHKMNRLFENHVALIFQHRDLVLNKAEYYLLNPDILSSGGMYIGGFKYSLGSLFESIESGNHYYYDEIDGHKELYLVSMASSPLSGSVFKALFWSDHEKQLLRLEKNLSGVKSPSIGVFHKMVAFSSSTIDEQTKALQQLINEINDLNNISALK